MITEKDIKPGLMFSTEKNSVIISARQKDKVKITWFYEDDCGLHSWVDNVTVAELLKEIRYWKKDG